jgi:hypothetical protein
MRDRRSLPRGSASPPLTGQDGAIGQNLATPILLSPPERGVDGSGRKPQRIEIQTAPIRRETGGLRISR